MSIGLREVADDSLSVGNRAMNNSTLDWHTASYDWSLANDHGLVSALGIFSDGDSSQDSVDARIAANDYFVTNHLGMIGGGDSSPLHCSAFGGWAATKDHDTAVTASGSYWRSAVDHRTTHSLSAKISVDD